MHDPTHFYSSVMTPWFTVREVKVDIEIVRRSLTIWPLHELITRQNSHHRKWPSFVLNAVCSKGSWPELLEVLLWNIMHLGLYRTLLLSC